MMQQRTSMPEDLEPLRQQLTEFRHTQPVRSRLPEALWAEATELAIRYGVHRIARELHLDYTGLKKRVEQQARPKPKHAASVTPTFVEVVGPAVPVTPCRVEVESSHGKLRFELPAMAPTELVSLLGSVRTGSEGMTSGCVEKRTKSLRISGWLASSQEGRL